MMYIYKITNLINGKVYIGQHKWNGEGLDPNYFCSSANPHFWNAIKKYGIENFKKELVQKCYSDTALDIMEKMWIRVYKSTDENYGYNLTEGPGGWNYINNTPELKQKSKDRVHELYGNPNVFLRSESANEKRKATVLYKYGSLNGNMMTDEANRKRTETLINKYGSITGQLHTEEVHKKSANTRKIRYKWLRSDGEIVICPKFIASRYEKTTGLSFECLGLATDEEIKLYYDKIKPIHNTRNDKLYDILLSDGSHKYSYRPSRIMKKYPGSRLLGIVKEDKDE